MNPRVRWRHWSVCGVYVECVWSVYGVCMECVGRSFSSCTAGTRCTLTALMAAIDAASAFCWIRSSRSLHYSRYFTPFQYWPPETSIVSLRLAEILSEITPRFSLLMLSASDESFLSLQSVRFLHNEKDIKDYKCNFLNFPVVLFCHIANALNFMKSMFFSDPGRKKNEVQSHQFAPANESKEQIHKGIKQLILKYIFR